MHYFYGSSLYHSINHVLMNMSTNTIIYYLTVVIAVISWLFLGRKLWRKRKNRKKEMGEN